MGIYYGLIIPRSYNDYINKSQPQEFKTAMFNTGLIPAAATAQNQLADKNFVNSSIGTNTANYIYKTTAGGDNVPFDSVEELEAYTGTVTQNDYAFVTGLDGDGNRYYDRYKANETAGVITWGKEYRLNNSSFTAEQWAAVNSGMTAAVLERLLALPTMDDIQDAAHPVGYVYTQWPGEKSPLELGLYGTWEDISSTKAGLFIRVAGGDAAAFGEIQSEGLPNITGSFRAAAIASWTASGAAKSAASGVSGEWTGTNKTSLKDNNNVVLDASESNEIYGASEHVTPINTAIKVWKRTA